MSGTSVRCLAGPAMQGDAMGLVTVSAVAGTGLDVFSYDAPVGSAGMLNTVLTGGSSVTVTGLNFGYVALSGSVALSRDLCRTVSWTSVTTIACMSSALSGALRMMSVTISATVGTGLDVLSFDAPVGSHVLMNTPQSGRAFLTLLGLNFGYVDHSPTAMLASAPCKTASWTSETQLRCVSGQLASASMYLSVTISATVGTGLGVLSFDAGVVSTVVRNTPQSGGASMTLLGLNFGYSVYTESVSLGGRLCSTSSWMSGTSVRCHVQVAVAADQTSVVTVSAVSGTGLDVFSYDAPVVSSAVLNAPWSGGAAVTVNGLNFGYSELTASSAVGGVLCGSSSWSSATSVVCETGPATSSRMGEVTVSALVGTSSKVLSYDGPVVSMAWQNTPPTGGAAVTVTGLNFGYSEYTSTGAIALGACVTASWASGTTVVCVAGRAQTALLMAEVTVSAVAGTGLELPFTFDGVCMEGQGAG